MTDRDSVSDAEVAPPDRTPWADLLVAAVSVAAGYRILRLIDLHAVNLLYWDQFSLYEAFRADASAWELFRWQHGPHRQGVAFLVTGWIAQGTAWNTRIDAFAVGATVCAATALALWLRRRLYGRFHPADVAIPLLLLTPAQYGIFIHTPNLSHGAAPLLLLLLFCLALTLRRPALRYGALVVLDFLLIHTGFGIVLGALTPLLLCVCAFHDWRERGLRGLLVPGLCVALSLACVGIFLIGYDARDLDQVSVTRPLPECGVYVALMFANVLGLKGTTGIPVLIGSLAAFATLGVAAEQTARLLGPGRPQPLQGPAFARRPTPSASLPRGFVILTLTSFTLLFAATAALGRSALGLPSAQSTRYVPLVVPALLGLYLRLQEIQRPGLRVPLLVLSVFSIVLATVPMRASEERFMHHLSRGKRIWVDAYLTTGSLEAANEHARLRIFPFRAPEVPRMLEFIREHRLNFYAERD